MMSKFEFIGKLLGFWLGLRPYLFRRIPKIWNVISCEHTHTHTNMLLLPKHTKRLMLGNDSMFYDMFKRIDFLWHIWWQSRKIAFRLCASRLESVFFSYCTQCNTYVCVYVLWTRINYLLNAVKSNGPIPKYMYTHNNSSSESGSHIRFHLAIIQQTAGNRFG